MKKIVQIIANYILLFNEGLLGDIENPDEWIDELLQSLPSPGTTSTAAGSTTNTGSGSTAAGGTTSNA